MYYFGEERDPLAPEAPPADEELEISDAPLAPGADPLDIGDWPDAGDDPRLTAYKPAGHDHGIPF